MEKINVLQEYNDSRTRWLQVVYLNEYGFSMEIIQKWTCYAISTIKNYIRKYHYLLDEAKKMFYHVTQDIKILLMGGREICYLFKFYNANGVLIFSKVGTTTRLPEQRLNEELRYYKKKGLSVEYGEIISLIDCGLIPAEGAESVARGYFIKKHPSAFYKNDRFFDVDISKKEFDNVVLDYLGQETTPFFFAGRTKFHNMKLFFFLKRG